MIYCAVIDTNVLVSSMLCPNSLPGEILRLIKIGTIQPAYNDEMLKEYKEVLGRNKFPFSQEEIDENIKEIIENGLQLERTKTNEAFTDKDDIVFYEIVLTANSKNSSYLVTGNVKHFPKKTFVVTPREMIDIIESQN